MRYAIINTKTNIVENLIDYDDSPLNPPSGFDGDYLAVADSISSIGWVYNINGTFSNPTPTPISKVSLSYLAQIELDKSDISVTRILEAKIDVPADITAYRLALRNIVNGSDTTSMMLPTKPTDYPSGT